MSARWVAFAGFPFVLALCTAARADDANTCAEMYTRAQTLRSEHKLLEARAALRACAQSSCKDFIVKDCIQWAGEVEPGIPSVLPVAVDGAGNDLPGIRVWLDGAELARRDDGLSTEVNPGPHTFDFEAPDGTRAQKVLVVAEGERNKRVQVTFEKAPVAAVPPSPVVVAAPPRTVTEKAAVPWKTLGLVGMGAGALGIGAGLIAGGVALHRRNAAGCDGAKCATAQDAAELRSAQGAGTASTLLVIVGGVLAAGGATAWLLAPGPVQVTPSVGANQASIQVAGRW